MKKNKQGIITARHDYYRDNRDQILAKKKEYRERNKDRITDYNTAYYEKNKDSINARRRELWRTKKLLIKIEINKEE